MLERIERCESEGLLRRQERPRFHVGDEPLALLDRLLASDGSERSG